MDRTDLAQLIAEQERQALGYHGGDLSEERSKALDYYNGKPFGNEVEGRSQVVSSDVFDAVEGMLPVLVKMFAATSEAVEFEPVGLEDEESAKQATAACNYVFYKQNNGVLILYSWFKDALLQKNGIVKWYYEDKTEKVEETYEGLTQPQYESIVADDNVEVLEHSEYPDEYAQQQMAQQLEMMAAQGMPAPMLHDVKVSITKEYGKVCIDPVPPEEFIVAAGHNSIDLDNCSFCAHRAKKTISDLKQMGFSDKDLEDIGDGDSDGQWNEERQSRNQYQEENDPETGQSADPAMREVWVSQGYIRADKDKDGIAELIRFTKAGNKVLEDEKAESIDFAALTPIVMPHRFIGKSMADVTADFQMVNSTLWRQGLDNLYLTNNPRHAVIENMANLDDLLTSRPGGIVRMRDPQAVTPLVTPFVAQHIFPMLEYNESRKENRTGVSRYNQGTDGDSLNKTAHGVQLIQNASMQRAELIGRMFAETGVKRLFRGIKRTLYKSGLRKLSLRLNGQYVDVDPREWATEWDMTVNVGLGTGNKDQQLIHLQRIFATMGAMAQMGKGYMISDENLYSVFARMVENSGFQHVESFVTHPKSIPDEKKQPPPPPEMMKMQLDAQESAAKLQSSEKQKLADLQTTERIEQMQAEVDRYKAELAAVTQEKTTAMTIQAQKEIKQMEIQAQAEMTVYQGNKEAEFKDADHKLEDKKMRMSADPKSVMMEDTTKEMHEQMQTVAQAFGGVIQQQAEVIGALQKEVSQIANQLGTVAKQVERTASQAAIEMKQAAQRKPRRKQGTFNGKPFDYVEQ